MKIQCNVCEAAEAKVLCCSDEAALCWACDEKVHAANKLASKHQRVLLSNSSLQIPKCDICQEAAGFFFCLEDRALLCRKCDVAIHTANSYVSAHQRFLLTGVKVGLEPADPGASSSSGKSPSAEKPSEINLNPFSRRGTVMPLANPQSDFFPANVVGIENFGPSKLPFSGGSSAEGIPQWQMDDFFALTDFNQHYGYMGNGSSKDESGKRSGDSDSSAVLRSAEEEVDNEQPGEVPDSSFAVPQMSSPPTASGLYWPKFLQNHSIAASYVPDICCSDLDNHQHRQHHNNAAIKRQRRS